ncbi:MAG: 3'-5' exonuclease [Helicobacteraceae bacterium]|jgi:DNA polymerase III epsilon subunit-like protein|nr:3'-5' exonuclease [Helicobacteraceae bacterium]
MAAFILLDTETTGGGEKDRICQLAFLVARTKEPLKLFNSLCKPPVAIDFEAMAIHHITPEAIEDKPPFAECEAAIALNELNTEENALVIQNAPFDLEMLRREGFEWKGVAIDTLRVSRHLLGDLPRHSLQYLRYALSLYRSEGELAAQFGGKISAHDAASDCVVLYLLTQYLLAMTGKSKDGVFKLIELSNKPVALKTIRFGKHRDKSFNEIAKTDRGYLEWLFHSETQKESPDSDLVYTLEQVLAADRQ